MLPRSPPRMCEATSFTDQSSQAVGSSHSAGLSPERSPSKDRLSSGKRSTTSTGPDGLRILLPSPGLSFPGFHNDHAVLPAEAEAVDEGCPDLHGAGLVGNVIEVAGGVGELVIDGGRGYP